MRAYFLPILLALAGPAAADGVLWTHDYAAARERARREGRPLFVEFSAEW